MGRGMTTSDWITVAVVWGVLALIVASIAYTRGHSIFYWLAFSLVLSPVIAIVALLLTPQGSHAVVEAPQPTAPAAVVSSSFCPKCGKPRMVGAQFCPSCGSAYATASPPAAAVAETKPGLGASERIVVLLIVLAVIGGGYVLLNNGGRATVNVTDAPPTGVIWFGDTYDPTTFALTGRSTSHSMTQQTAMVASLSRSTRAEYLAITISSPEAGSVPIGGGQMASGNNLMAYLIPALQVAGQYPVAVTDSGGNVLASGTLTVQ